MLRIIVDAANVDVSGWRLTDMNQGAGGTARLVGSFGQKFLPHCFFDFIQRMTVVGPGHENLPKLLVL
jgi:hypothetical protein